MIFCTSSWQNECISNSLHSLNVEKKRTEGILNRVRIVRTWYRDSQEFKYTCVNKMQLLHRRHQQRTEHTFAHIWDSVQICIFAHFLPRCTWILIITEINECKNKIVVQRNIYIEFCKGTNIHRFRMILSFRGMKFHQWFQCCMKPELNPHNFHFQCKLIAVFTRRIVNFHEINSFCVIKSPCCYFQNWKKECEFKWNTDYSWKKPSQVKTITISLLYFPRKCKRNAIPIHPSIWVELFISF